MRVLSSAADRFWILGALPHRRTVGHENEIELAAFGGLGKRPVMIDVQAGIGLCVRMAPSRGMMACRHDERSESHLSLLCAHWLASKTFGSFRPGTSTPNRLSSRARYWAKRASP